MIFRLFTLFYFTRKINPDHLRQFKWLTYSHIKKGYFCKYCVLFPTDVVGAQKCSQQSGKLVKHAR